MPRVLVLLDDALAQSPFLSATVLDHFKRLALEAGCEAQAATPDTPVDDSVRWVLDGRYPCVPAEALAETETAVLITPQGDTVGAGVGPDAKTAAQVLDQAVGTRVLAVLAHRADRPAESARAEQHLRAAHAAALEHQGVRLVDPGRVTIDPSVRVAAGATLWTELTLLGQTVIEAGAEVRAGCWLVDTYVGARAVIKPHSVCEGAIIGPDAAVGPMAHLRAGTVLDAEVKVGNFVEVKKTHLHRGAKASHLTYLGDTDVGEAANIGAGTITCNYDGFRKQRTTIGAGAFIGSNSSLVAPVTIGAGAMIAAGSVITQAIADDELAVTRAPLKRLPGKARVVNNRNRRLAARAKADKEGPTE